jgi:hypothetical protein
MKTKSDDIKLLAEAYGKIYAEQSYSNLPPEEDPIGYAEDDDIIYSDEEPVHVNSEIGVVYIVIDTEMDGKPAVHRVFTQSSDAEEEVENLNSIPRNKDRYDILEMPVE